MAGNYQIRVMENGRIAARGLHRIGQGVGMTIDDDEIIQIKVDWSAFLGADTIATVSNDGNGATVSAASNTTTTTQFNIAATHGAIIEHRITTNTGQRKELPIFINGTEGFYGGRGYYD